jgi:hypothetical protein
VIRRFAMIVFIAVVGSVIPSARAASSAGGSGELANTPVAQSSLLVSSIPSLARPATADKESSLFSVKDDKGLLLTCVAPKNDLESYSDRLEDCSLAPGRTLSDVLRSFMGAIHSEISQHEQERAAWLKQIEEMMDQKMDSSSGK